MWPQDGSRDIYTARGFRPPQGASLDGIRSLDLLVRSRVAISQFEGAKAGGDPAEIADARAAPERCHAEVKRFVAAKKAIAKMLATAARPLKPAQIFVDRNRIDVSPPRSE